ncbi:MAG: hypothetical protein R3E32_02990 [Chitinophagales bacterium]
MSNISVALKLIANEKRRKTGKLNLGHCGLANLSKDIPTLFELEWLEELILTNGPTSEYFDYEEGADNSLRYSSFDVKMIPNKIDKLPSELTRLVHLKKLSISGDWNTGGNLQKLEYLPDGLEVLEADYNKIPDLNALPSGLKSLSIKFNQIKKIESLPMGLQTLSVGGNKIKKLENLPDTLRELNAGYGKIRTLQNLPDSLLELYLFDNDIERIENLPIGLEKLDLCSNKIRSIENLPSKLESLKILNNRIREIGVIPISLKYINVDGNLIEDLTPLKDFFSLYISISFDDNPIKIPPMNIVEEGNEAIIDFFKKANIK